MGVCVIYRSVCRKFVAQVVVDDEAFCLLRIHDGRCCPATLIDDLQITGVSMSMRGFPDHLRRRIRENADDFHPRIVLKTRVRPGDSLNFSVGDTDVYLQ